MHAAVGERVAERVQRIGVFRILLQDRAQVALRHLDQIQLLGDERARVQQILVPRQTGKRLGQCIERRLMLLGLAQDLFLGERELHAL